MTLQPIITTRLYQQVAEQIAKLKGMRRPIFKAISTQVQLSTNALRAVQDHRIIYDAIAAGDPDQAKQAMHRHLEQVKGVLMQNGNTGKGS